jgi:hypothetical protein
MQLQVHSFPSTFLAEFQRIAKKHGESSPKIEKLKELSMMVQTPKAKPCLIHQPIHQLGINLFKEEGRVCFKHQIQFTD